MSQQVVGLGKTVQSRHLRDINGLILVAAVMLVTVVMASAAEVKFNRLADEMAHTTQFKTAMTNLNCPLKASEDGKIYR